MNGHKANMNKYVNLITAAKHSEQHIHNTDNIRQQKEGHLYSSTMHATKRPFKRMFSVSLYIYIFFYDSLLNNLLLFSADFTQRKSSLK